MPCCHDLADDSRYMARVELSSKVVDCPDRLRRTLAHELCHVAAWLIDHSSKPPHGQVWLLEA